MRTAPQRIAGWSCIAIAKVCSLALLWQAVIAVEPGGFVGAHLVPLAAATVAMIAAGLWLLWRSERA
ncbi:MAG: hypothetical protein ACTHOH_15690 [Lysobacteraceae bacterium]